MKNLLYIPIVHNKADLGSLGSQLSLDGEKKYGVATWHNHLEQVDKSWADIESEIFRQLTNIPFARIKIYQDGLPAVGDIGRQIVSDAAKKGSKNYSIVDDLLARGATLEMAENKELLFKEYYLLSDISKAETPEKQLEAYLIYQNAAQQLLYDRDSYIAGQINTTLNDEETGIAFFGAAHAVIDKLNEEIRVTVIQMFTDEISLNLSKIKMT